MFFLLERLAEPPGFNGACQLDLRSAIAGQIQRLLSIRLVEAAGEINLVNMGCGDVVELALNNEGELQRYAQRLKELILLYEPRLLSPRVQVRPTSDFSNVNQLVVSGALAISPEVHTFYFELPLH